MTAKIEKYFCYYWKNDKNFAMITDEDVAIMDELPDALQIRVYKDFLFEDFLE